VELIATGAYQPSPYTPGWEVWFGAAVATIPFVIGAWEFGKRIVSAIPATSVLPVACVPVLACRDMIPAVTPSAGPS
jgi:hypothetical protein